ncbi:MAG: cytochrome C [Anaerolineaceae bacterium]|nr:cytochrome C [Anaerolineaceae bacterium]
MKIKPMFAVGALVVTILALAGMIGSTGSQAQALTPIEELGKFLLFDTELSTPRGQDCAACHAPATGYTGPDSEINATLAVYPGAIDHRFGNRKPPTAAYGGDSPILYYDEDDEVWVGGMFWDGRASGWTLGDPLAEQAQGPFLNPVEQNNPGIKQVCLKVRKSAYAGLFEQVWGPGSLDCGKGLELTYEYIARSIAAYERSAEVNPFSSKFDLFWDNALAAGLDVTAINVGNWEQYKGYGLSDDEVYGLALFTDEEKGKCALCHTFDLGEAGRPLFTDFTYDNLGVPKNPANPWYSMSPNFNPDGADWIDPGLAGFLQAAGFDEDVYMDEMGKHKVPTLRNVDLRPYPEFVKAYTHNGFFKSLEEITRFYNTRDVDPSWPEPEYAGTVNTEELGNLGLTADEEAGIVLFMKTLSDGFQP